LKVLIAGATGLVGQLVLTGLERRVDITRIDSVGRRASTRARDGLEVHAAPIEAWPALVAEIAPDIVVSALGTTLRTAGSEEAFAAIDHDAVISLARAAHMAGARQFMSISSVGAREASRNFYLAVKGKVEREIQAVGFQRVDFFRPGLLRGKRSGPFRLGERAAAVISPVTDLLTPKALDHYRSIAANDVAGAVLANLGKMQNGVFVHHNRDMWQAVAGYAP
jgi:uncharacterized protein YbjT (DUF2867 family)